MASHARVSELRRFRREANWLQEDLAKYAEVDQGTISRLERGATKRPGAATLDKLARTLNARFRRLHKRIKVSAADLLKDVNGAHP